MEKNLKNNNGHYVDYKKKKEKKAEEGKWMRRKSRRRNNVNERRGQAKGKSEIIVMDKKIQEAIFSCLNVRASL